MGKVLNTIKVYPQEGYSLEALKQNLSKVKGFYKAVEEPVAFGLVVLKAYFILDDKEGGDVESEVQKVEGVSEIQPDEVTLIS
jgi:translation elongation factor EF-1beta